MTALSAAALVTLAFVAYWLPSIVAYLRLKCHIGQVIVVNAFLGWTFVGWVIALAMAFGATETTADSG